MTVRSSLVVAAGAELVAATCAAAHVDITPRQIPPQKLARLTVTVENERVRASTVKVAIKLPSNLIVVRFEPKPGWRRTTTIRPLARPLRINGQTIRRRAEIVTWVARKRGFGPGHVRSAFRLRAVARTRAGRTLAFPTVQTYSNGEITRWIGSPDSDTPAARVTIR